MGNANLLVGQVPLCLHNSLKYLNVNFILLASKSPVLYKVCLLLVYDVAFNHCHFDVDSIVEYNDISPLACIERAAFVINAHDLCGSFVHHLDGFGER